MVIRNENFSISYGFIMIMILTPCEPGFRGRIRFHDPRCSYFLQRLNLANAVKSEEKSAPKDAPSKVEFHSPVTLCYSHFQTCYGLISVFMQFTCKRSYLCFTECLGTTVHLLKLRLVYVQHSSDIKSMGFLWFHGLISFIFLFPN